MTRKLLALILIIGMFLGAGHVVNAAEDRSYHMSSFIVNAELDTYGNLSVEEQITYEFEGSFNGVYRTLRTAQSHGIDQIEVYVLSGNNFYALTQDDSEGENTFQLLQESDGIKIKAFSRSSNESKSFLIKYIVMGAATKYQDTGELYWKFMGTETDVDILDFTVNIKLPQDVPEGKLRAFAHGPLSGAVSLPDPSTVTLFVKKLLPHQFVEARILFPEVLIAQSDKVVSADAMERILDEEADWANEANAKRWRARLVIFLSALYAVIELFMILFLYFKYDKEFKTHFKGEYFRELPGKYSPAVLSVLWNFGGIHPKDITAVLMDLVRRRYLRLIAEQVEIKGFIKHKVETDYAFELNPDADPEQLTKQEKYLIDWLITTVGNGSRVTLNQIESSSKTVSGAKSFKEDYDAWTAYVREEAEEYGFFDKNAVKGQIYGVLTAVAGMVFGGYTAAVHGNIAGFVLLLITSLVLLVYALLIKKRSKYGAEQFKMWKAFRRFLLHFSTMDQAKLPAVVIWEHYLVYAISLGVAKEVVNQLKLVFREETFNNSSLTFMYYGAYRHHDGYFNTLNHITDTMVKTTESTYTQAMSKLSSSSGSKGGGFSGGGGGGGGGGGAGAF